MSTATLPPISDAHSDHFPPNALRRKRSRSRSLTRDSIPPPPATRRRSVSPVAGSSRLDLPRVEDADPVRRRERERQLALKMSEDKEKDKEKEKPAADSQAEFQKLISTKSGGVYIPPSRLRAMQAEAAKDKSSTEYQRMAWDALRKSITGIVNRVNISNIKDIVPELFEENLIRGRGLFARSIMKAQASSLPFTLVFAALVAIVNTKLPQVGELLLIRLVSQFRRAFKRNDKVVCHSTTTFIAHLVNQAIAPEIIALQIHILLLERPTDDSIEIAVGFMREVGAFLAENAPKANASVYERFRAVLNEGTISQRVQYMIEVLMQVRKDKYKDNPIIPEGLDLVEDEEQITHEISLDDELQVQEGLNIFKFDPDYLENEEKYKEIKVEILGEESADEDSDGSGSDEDAEEGGEEVAEAEGIEDKTSTNLINLRRTIYLTIMNALNYEEAVHKLLKVQIEEGDEIEMVKMVIECCSQERSYSKFYGLILERFSKLNRVWTDALQQSFRDYYETMHRYETNRLRNIARIFGHLVATDAISWTVFEAIKMNEDETTSSSRIFVKIMLGEVIEAMGLKQIAERCKDPEVRTACQGMFPMDNPKNTRFAINYFTSIGLGIVTEEMREHLKNAPRLIMEQRRALMEESSSSDSDSDPSSDSDSSDSDSKSDSSPSNSSDSRSPSRSRSRSPRRRALSRSPVRRRRSPTPDRYREPVRGRNNSRSLSPPAHRGGRGVRADSHSPPPPPRRDERNGYGRYDDRNRDMPRARAYGRDRSPPAHKRERDDSPGHHRARTPLSPPYRKERVPDSPPRRRERSPYPSNRRPRSPSTPPRRTPSTVSERDDRNWRANGHRRGRSISSDRRSRSSTPPPRRLRDEDDRGSSYPEKGKGLRDRSDSRDGYKGRRGYVRDRGADSRKM